MSALSAAVGPYVTTANVLWFVAAMFAAAWGWMLLAGSVEVPAEPSRAATPIKLLHQRATRRQQEQEKV